MTPYQYGALNPISNIDMNGDSVWVTHNTGFLGLGKKETLRYDDGNLYNKDGSAYGGKVKGFLKDAVGALNTLAEGDEGGKDLKEMESSTVNTSIVHSSDGNSYSPDATGHGGTVNFDPSSGQGGLDTKGSGDRPSYIGLGHELLGHGLDNERGTLNTGMIPGAGIPYAEQFSTHIENMLRAEHLLPLRAFYGVDATGAGTYPLINGAGQSLFYNNYDYNNMNGLRTAPIRLIVPANTLSPATIRPIKITP